MKAIFIAYNQSYGEEIVELLDKHGQRGFTRWLGVQGRGSINGNPHFDNHAWPEENVAILVFCEDSKSEEILAALHRKDEKYPELGLRAFYWDAAQAF